MRLNSIMTAAAVVVILIAANYLAARHPLRLDLTRHGIYTLSPATRDILEGLDDVLTVRVYFSKDLPPELQPISRDVDDILGEYKGFAGKNFQVEHVDPSSSALEEQKAAMMGIPPLKVNVIRRDKQEVAKIYLGLAVLYGGREQAIPVVQRTGNLEYLLDEAIVMVSSETMRRIAWWEPRAIGPEDGDGYTIVRQLLARRYEIVDLSAENAAELDPEVFEALVLISPRQMDEGVLKAIEGYVGGGGKTIALIDRWILTEGLMFEPVTTQVTKMLSGLGVTVEDSLVLDELNATAAFTGGIVTYHIPYAYWPDVRFDGFNRELPITSDLESAVMPFTSPLMLAGDARPPGKEAVVAMTSPSATQVPGTEARLDPKLADEALADGLRSRLILIALLGDDLFVAGSSHWATDRFVSMFPQNADLFQNAVDYFAMGDALIGIRSRESMGSPIVPVPDTARFWFKYLNVAAGPMIVGAIGIAFMILRRAGRRRAVKLYG